MLAAAFLAGEWERGARWPRGRGARSGRRAWLRRVALEVLDAYHRPPLDRPRELGGLRRDRARRAARRRGCRRACCASRCFTRRWAARRWPVPRIDTVGDLAELLELDAGQLAWLADVRGLERDGARRAAAPLPLRAACRATHGPPRVIERPEAAAEGDPAPDPARAAGLDPGPRRPRTGSSAAARRARTPRVHTGRRVVVRLDLEDFFAGVDRRAGVRDLPHGRLSGGGRAHADRAVHERRAGRASPSPGTAGSRAGSRRRTCRRARRPRPRWPTSPRSGSTAA